MRKLFSALAILMTAGTAWGTVYYVDCAADGDAGAGTSTAANVAWKTVAKVNSSSFSAGDSVLFNKGCTWREQLTVPSSGSAGNPITFGAYGSGAAPILSGANLITPGTSWTAVAGTPVVAEQQTTGGTAQAFRNQADQLINTQGFASDSSITVPYVDVPIRKAGSPTGNMWFEIWGTSGTPFRYASVLATSNTLDVSTLTTSLVTHRFTFSPPVSISASTGYLLAVSGDFTVNASNNVLWDLGTGDRYRGDDPYCWQRYQAGPTYNYDVNHDFVFAIYKDVVSSTIWTASVTTEPKQVFFDNVRGTHVANQAACTSEGKWFWADNVLSVYSATDPDTAYTAPGIEVSQRNYVAVIDDIDYVTIDGLTLTKANNTSVAFYNGSPDHDIVKNSDISYAAEGYGI